MTIKTLPSSIPLVSADLTTADERAVRSQLIRSPFGDDALLTRWEAAWEDLWSRSAVAFAEPKALILALKSVLGWRSGDCIGADALLEPAWTEALDAAWLSRVWRDIDPSTGQGQGRFRPWDGTLRAGFATHAYGLPSVCTEQAAPFWLEEISSIVRPMPNCGWGDVQLLHLSGNRMLTAGASCLLLSKDEALCRALKTLRPHPPSALACALGLSQMQSLNVRLERRRERAERYRELLHPQGLFCLPVYGAVERVWETFLLAMPSTETRLMLQQFLQKSHVFSASPLWFRQKRTEDLPGFNRFHRSVLALPLYASLEETQQKRIINRVNRWVAYRIKKQP